MEIRKNLLLMVMAVLVLPCLSSCDKEDGDEPIYVKLNIEGSRFIEDHGEHGYFVQMSSEGGVINMSPDLASGNTIAYINCVEYEQGDLLVRKKFYQYAPLESYEWDWGRIDRTSGDEKYDAYKITLEPADEYSRTVTLDVGGYPFINRIQITQPQKK